MSKRRAIESPPPAPVHVFVAGLPGVGKSTLVNHLLTSKVRSEMAACFGDAPLPVKKPGCIGTTIPICCTVGMSGGKSSVCFHGDAGQVLNRKVVEDPDITDLMYSVRVLLLNNVPPETAWAMVTLCHPALGNPPSVFLWDMPGACTDRPPYLLNAVPDVILICHQDNTQPPPVTECLGQVVIRAHSMIPALATVHLARSANIAPPMSSRTLRGSMQASIYRWLMGDQSQRRLETDEPGARRLSKRLSSICAAITFVENMAHDGMWQQIYQHVITTVVGLIKQRMKDLRGRARFELSTGVSKWLQPDMEYLLRMQMAATAADTTTAGSITRGVARYYASLLRAHFVDDPPSGDATVHAFMYTAIIEEKSFNRCYTEMHQYILSQITTGYTFTGDRNPEYFQLPLPNKPLFSSWTHREPRPDLLDQVIVCYVDHTRIYDEITAMKPPSSVMCHMHRRSAPQPFERPVRVTLRFDPSADFAICCDNEPVGVHGQIVLLLMNQKNLSEALRRFDVSCYYITGQSKPNENCMKQIEAVARIALLPHLSALDVPWRIAIATVATTLYPASVKECWKTCPMSLVTLLLKLPEEHLGGHLRRAVGNVAADIIRYAHCTPLRWTFPITLK